MQVKTSHDTTPYQGEGTQSLKLSQPSPSEDVEKVALVYSTQGDAVYAGLWKFHFRKWSQSLFFTRTCSEHALRIQPRISLQVFTKEKHQYMLTHLLANVPRSFIPSYSK